MDTVEHPRRPARISDSGALEPHPDARAADCIVWFAIPDASPDGSGPQAEGLPAVRLDGDRARIAAIPYFPYHVAFGDEVTIRELDGTLYCTEVAIAAAQLTVRVFEPMTARTEPEQTLTDPAADEPFWRILRALAPHGVWFERYSTSYAALSVEPGEWQYVRAFLELKERIEGLQWELATPLRDVGD